MSGSLASSSIHMGNAEGQVAVQAWTLASLRWGWPSHHELETAGLLFPSPQVHVSGSDGDPAPTRHPRELHSTHTTVGPQSFGAANRTSRCRIARPCLGTWRAG